MSPAGQVLRITSDVCNRQPVFLADARLGLCSCFPIVSGVPWQPDALLPGFIASMLMSE